MGALHHGAASLTRSNDINSHLQIGLFSVIVRINLNANYYQLEIL
jgi:hypothetical protein